VRFFAAGGAALRNRTLAGAGGLAAGTAGLTSGAAGVSSLPALALHATDERAQIASVYARARHQGLSRGTRFQLATKTLPGAALCHAANQAKLQIPYRLFHRCCWRQQKIGLLGTPVEATGGVRLLAQGPQVLGAGVCWCWWAVR